jgi:CheY-like chemotaxis protein
MDLSLPRMDGWEATRRLKRDEALAHIPVIVLTAHAMHGDEERARACGCDDFLTKPIDENQLFEKIARHLGR